MTGGRGRRFPFANVCAWLCERVRRSEGGSVCVVRALFGWLCFCASNATQVGVDGLDGLVPVTKSSQRGLAKSREGAGGVWIRR